MYMDTFGLGATLGASYTVLHVGTDKCVDRVTARELLHAVQRRALSLVDT